MKPTLLFALLTSIFAVPSAPAMSELDTLRARCAAQEQQIQRLEGEVRRLKPDSAVLKSTSAPSRSAAIATPTAPATAAGTYVVRSGDSFEKIARRNGCSVAALAKANGLKPTSMIHPGQKLSLPNKVAASSIASTSSSKMASPIAMTSATSAASSTPSAAGRTHTIRAGETFSSISRKHNTSVASLIAANPKVQPTALRPGQVIQLTAGSSAAPSEASSRSMVKSPAKSSPSLAHTAPTAPRTQVANAQAAPRSLGTITPVLSTHSGEARSPSSQPADSEPATLTSSPATIPVSAPLPTNRTQETLPQAEQAPATSNSPSPSNPEKKIRSVTIEGEMTYGEFAANHGTDTSRLNDLNGLDLTNATVLAKGSELYVPAQP